MSQIPYNDTCKGCGKDIVFMPNTKTGRMHPYELDQKTSHFATCPAAIRFRRSRPKEAEQPSLFDHHKLP